MSDWSERQLEGFGDMREYVKHLRLRATEFRLREEHLTLMEAMNVRFEWSETGAPAIDPKRPYGNSDVLGDMAELLGVEPLQGEGWDEFRDRIYSDMMKLHAETMVALQICLSTQSFTTGRYKREKYSDWRKV